MVQMVRRAPEVEVSRPRAGLRIQAGRWYAWQMLPGYGDGVPYFSPIFVHRVTLSPNNPNILDVDFANVLYAVGVQGFHTTIRPLLRASTYVVAELLEGEADSPVRTGIISAITFEWLERFCPQVLKELPLRTPPDGKDLTIAAYLTASFGLG